MKQLIQTSLAMLLCFGLTVQADAQPEKRGNKQGANKKRRGPQGGGNFAKFLKQLDKDGDGKVSKAEAPEQMKARFDRLDANSDGFIDQAEQKQLIERMARFRRGNKSGAAKNVPSDRPKGDEKDDIAKRKGRPGADQARRFDLARLFKAMDTNGDGVLDQKEQKAIIARFNEMRERGRMAGRPGGDKAFKGKRRSPNSGKAVKPKRPPADDDE